MDIPVSRRQFDTRLAAPAATASEHVPTQYPDRWHNGKLWHPRDACIDTDGNILIAEWMKAEDITRLTKLS
jgi:hypothetical protein